MGPSAPAGSSRRVVAATLSRPTSTSDRPALRSAKMRVAREEPEPPSVCTGIPYFSVNTLMTVRYSGIAPMLRTSFPSFLAEATSSAQSFSKAGFDCAVAGAEKAAAREKTTAESPTRTAPGAVPIALPNHQSSRLATSFMVHLSRLRSFCQTRSRWPNLPRHSLRPAKWAKDGIPHGLPVPAMPLTLGRQTCARSDTCLQVSVCLRPCHGFLIVGISCSYPLGPCLSNKSFKCWHWLLLYHERAH
jgi:hypothetical protein